MTARRKTAPVCDHVAGMIEDTTRADPVETVENQLILPLAAIEASPLNPRKTIDPAGVEELAASIRQHGLLQNLVVRPAARHGRYLIVAGERRFRALQLLVGRGQWDAAGPLIPCRLVEGGDADHLALALLENLQRQDVNPIEEAEAFAELQRIDAERWSAASIASRLGCSQRHIEGRLALIRRLAPQAQDAMRQGLLTVRQARALQLANHEEQVKLVANPDRIPDERQLRDQVVRNGIPWSRAIFDPLLYDGEVIELDRAKYFGDRAKFLALQEAACRAKAEGLAGSRAWARAETNHYFSDYKFTKTEPGPTTGCIVHMEAWSGKVTVHDGLVERNPEADFAERQASYAAETAMRDARLEAAARFRDRLSAALTAHDMLCLIGANLAEYGESVRSCLRNVQLNDDPDYGDIPDRWQGQGLAAICADLVDTFRHRLRLPPFGALPPLIVRLARQHSIPIPAHLRGDQADIEDAIADAAPAPPSTTPPRRPDPMPAGFGERLAPAGPPAPEPWQPLP